MLETLISSKTRLNLLFKFFLNPDNSAYLRGLSTELGESTNSVRIELNRFEQSGLVESHNEGNRKIYQANKRHPLYNEIRNILLKHFGIDQIVENIVKKLGDVKMVYLVGDLAKGQNSDIIDVILIGFVDHMYLFKLVNKTEKVLNRKIRYIVFSEQEARTRDWNSEKSLLLWQQEN